jgi:hypothetical protein
MASDDHTLKAQAFTGHVREGLRHLNGAAFLVQGEHRNKYLKKLQSFESFLEDMPEEAFIRPALETLNREQDTTDTQPGA